MLMFSNCICSISETWTDDSLLKQTPFKNFGFESSLSSMLNANSFRRGLSCGFRACG